MGIDLRLPKASIPDHSVPYTPLLPALHGNIYFSEWPHFNHLVDKVSDAINQLPVDNFDNCKCVKPSVKARLDIFLEFRFDDPDAKVIREQYAVCSLYETIFRNVQELVVHVTEATCWFLPKSYYLENANTIWRSFCIARSLRLSQCAPITKERIADFTLMMPTGEKSETPLCAFDLKGSSADILALEALGSTSSEEGLRYSHARAVDISSKQLYARFNTLFAADQKSKVKTTVSTELVSQALTYALSVASGCVFFCNYDFGVALEVLKRDIDGALHVRMSKPFRSDEQSGTVSAMIALSIHSIKRVKQDNGLPEYIHCLSARMTNISRDVNRAIERDDKVVVTNEDSEQEINGTISSEKEGAKEEKVRSDSSDLCGWK